MLQGQIFIFCSRTLKQSQADAHTLAYTVQTLEGHLCVCIMYACITLLPTRQVSHTLYWLKNHCTHTHTHIIYMHVFFSNSQWAVKTNYHCVMYQLKIGRLDLEFLGRISMSVCGEKKKPWQVWKRSLTHNSPNPWPGGSQGKDEVGWGGVGYAERMLEQTSV